MHCFHRALLISHIHCTHSFYFKRKFLKIINSYYFSHSNLVLNITATSHPVSITLEFENSSNVYLILYQPDFDFQFPVMNKCFFIGYEFEHFIGISYLKEECQVIVIQVLLL